MKRQLFLFLTVTVALLSLPGLSLASGARVGNSAAYSGGINTDKTSTYLTNCTFYGNIRGGIGNPWSERTAVNTIVANNNEYDCSFGFTSSSTNNLSTDNTCSPGFSIVTPEALKLTWQERVFALQPGSVAIDASANSDCPAVDQRGAARPLDGNNDGVAVCDIGSYEYSSIREYPLPTADSQPYGITVDSSNQVWFTELAGNKIGRLTPASGSTALSVRSTLAVTITEYTIPTAGSTPSDITLGPEGNLWFTEYVGNKIGRLTPAGVITEYPLPQAGSMPIAISAGPDGNLWFCEEGGNRIGKMNTSGTLLAEYNVPTANSGLNDIVAGPDGALWFTEYEGKKIGRITTYGTISEYTVGAKVFGIALGPDGNLWFTETIADRVGRITPGGVITEFDLPGDANGPQGIIAGPFNSLWVAANFSNKVLRVLLSGVVLSAYPIPTADSGAVMIAADSSGALWFTEMGANQIGQLTPSGGTLYLPLVLRSP
ncbi:MAG: virginiamycin B lyase family protein [Chloroflexota bacterium]